MNAPNPHDPLAPLVGAVADAVADPCASRVDAHGTRGTI